MCLWDNMSWNQNRAKCTTGTRAGTIHPQAPSCVLRIFLDPFLPTTCTRLLHDARAGQPHAEAHSAQGDYLKAMVFGGLDGILTSFAIVAGAAGSSPTSTGCTKLNCCRLSVTRTLMGAAPAVFEPTLVHWIQFPITARDKTLVDIPLSAGVVRSSLALCFVVVLKPSLARYLSFGSLWCLLCALVFSYMVWCYSWSARCSLRRVELTRYWHALAVAMDRRSPPGGCGSGAWVQQHIRRCTQHGCRRIPQQQGEASSPYPTRARIFCALASCKRAFHLVVICVFSFFW